VRGNPWVAVMARQFWQNAHNGDIWAVELDERGHVLDSMGPLYCGDFTEENIPSFESLDSDWLEEHRNEFVLYDDEENM
jgi:hypothetical protein